MGHISDAISLTDFILSTKVQLFNNSTHVHYDNNYDNIISICYVMHFFSINWLTKDAIAIHKHF